MNVLRRLTRINSLSNSFLFSFPSLSNVLYLHLYLRFSSARNYYLLFLITGPHCGTVNDSMPCIMKKGKRPAHCPIFSDKVKSFRVRIRPGILSSGSMHTFSCKFSFVAIAIDVAKSEKVPPCLGIVSTKPKRHPG